MRKAQAPRKRHQLEHVRGYDLAGLHSPLFEEYAMLRKG